MIFLGLHRKLRHLLRTHVEADVGGQHAAVLPAQRPDPQQPVVPDERGQMMDRWTVTSTGETQVSLSAAYRYATTQRWFLSRQQWRSLMEGMSSPRPDLASLLVQNENTAHDRFVSRHFFFAFVTKMGGN